MRVRRGLTLRFGEAVGPCPAEHGMTADARPHGYSEWVLPSEKSRAAKRGVSNGGGFPDLDLSFLFCPFLSFLGLSRFFRDFPGLLGDGPGIFPIRPFSLSQPFKSTYQEQSRKGTRHNLDLSRKNGKPPGLETSRFSFSQKRKKPININILGGTVSGTNRNRPWDKRDPSLGTNWDLSLGQTGLFLFNSTVKSPFCPVCPWDGWGFVPGTIVPQGPLEKCLCVFCWAQLKHRKR